MTQLDADAKERAHVTLREPQEISKFTDTREVLANARRDIARYGLDDYFIVDVDAHHVESESWTEVISYIENPVIRYSAEQSARNQSPKVALTHSTPGLNWQDAFGRIPHQSGLKEEVDDTSVHRDVTLVRRAMDSMGIDVQVVFPQLLLQIGNHPYPDIAQELLRAYTRWMVETILPADERIKAFVALPFEDPAASLRTVEEFADAPGVIGFMVTSQRHAGVHRSAYFPLYRELERRGMPIAFHAGPRRNDTWTSTMNRFLSVHALSFVTCNMAHLTNWVINGIPERFPGLKVIWVESGLAWIPFMMQRLDHSYLMRQSEAPLLKRLPSEYIREMYFTSQPMEADNLTLLESTFRAMDAENRLLYSSDWPHWDFDTPGKIAGLPFLTENARRNILGENARKVFNL
mgnify:CR=1 FL=1